MSLTEYGVRPPDDADSLVHVSRDGTALCDGGPLVSVELVAASMVLCRECRLMVRIELAQD